MMKFKIYFTINHVEDFTLIEGETILEIQEKAQSFKSQRPNASNFWSEPIK
jgi:hypothetical protein